MNVSTTAERVKVAAIVVVDTNVVVSGLLKPDSLPSRLMAAILTGRLRMAFDTRIITEYRDVLMRPKFGFSSRQVEVLLDAVQSDGIAVAAQFSDLSLPDPDDLKFVEVALACQPPATIVTGNLRHFPSDRLTGLSVVTPRAFLQHGGF